MTGRRGLCIIGALAASLLLVFTAATVDARGGRGGGGFRAGGGGGFGGGGISRRGPASNGSFRTPGASTRPSYSRPSTLPSNPQAGLPQTRPSTPRPGTLPAPQPPSGDRTGQRPGGAESRPKPPDRERAREDWQQHREERQEKRQEYAENAREDWQDYAEWDEENYYWVGGWYGPVIYVDDHVDWVIFVSSVEVGTALSAEAYRVMRVETKCVETEVVADQITYLKCGSNWYNRVMQGGSVTYVVVSPPPGH